MNDLQETSIDSTGKFQALESTMNQENLNYVNNLIKETEKCASTRQKSMYSKPPTLFVKKNNPVKVNINLNADDENIIHNSFNNNNDSEPRAQKLFDNFFRFKNSQDNLTMEGSSDNFKKTFSGEKCSTENYKKNNQNESNSSKETQSTKIAKNNSEFLKSIDEYLISLNTNEKEIGTAYFTMENEKKNQKNHLKEIENLKNDNLNLKMKNEKLENRMKEHSNAKRVFLQEYNILKNKEDENSNLVKFLQQELIKMKNHIEGLKFKLKVTQESLVKEKIEAENSMIALKRVLFT